MATKTKHIVHKKEHAHADKLEPFTSTGSHHHPSLEVHTQMSELSPKRLGTTLAVLSGCKLLIISLAAVLIGWGRPLLTNLLGSVFLGYSLSPVGILIGLVWSLLVGFIGGYLFALVYNKIGKFS